MRTLLRHGMRLHAIGECAKRLLAHSPKELSELIPRISQEIIIQKEKKLDSFYLEYMGWIKTKTISRYCPFKLPTLYFRRWEDIVIGVKEWDRI
jgi:hypothetical protein